MSGDPHNGPALGRSTAGSTGRTAGRAINLRDLCAGGVMILLGLFMAISGPRYRLGTLGHMGPGFFPTVLGVVLAGLGLVLAILAVVSPDPEGSTILPPQPEWFAWACILCSPLAFMLFGTYFGLAPATFACVFVAAMGDRTATLKGSLLLSMIVTFVGVGLFSYVLQVSMPILAWRGL